MILSIITALFLFLSANGGLVSVDLNRGMILNEPTNLQPTICRNPLLSSSFQLETKKGSIPHSAFRIPSSEFDSVNFSLIGHYNLAGNYLNVSGWANAPFGDYILQSSGGGFYVFTRNDTLRRVEEISGPGYIWDFKVRGNFVYCASGDKGLVIFDLTSIQNPRILGQLDIPYQDPRYNEVFGWGATGIELKDSFAFVTVRVGGFYVVNISNPSEPRIVGSNTQVQWLMDVHIKDDTLAFVTNYGPELTNGLVVYNINNPTNPIVLSTITEIARGRKFCIRDTLAYIAARYDGMYIVNIADPANPLILSNLILDEAQNVWVEIYGDTLVAFVSNLNNLVMIDVTDPTNPYEVTTIGVRSAAVWIEGNRLYNQGLVGIALYDITFPWSPQLITYYIYLGNPYHLTLRGDYAYIYDGYGYLRILDISEPANITEISQFAEHLESIPGGTGAANIGGMCLEEDYVYLIVRGFPFFCYIAIVKVTDPYNPEWVGTKMWSGYAGGNQPFVEDTLVFVPTALNNETFLRIINVSDPSNIQDVGLLHWPRCAALEVSKRDTLLFLAGGYDSWGGQQQTFYDLGIATVARLYMPIMITEFTTPNQCRAVDRFSQAPYIAVGDYVAGVHIINITNPASPQITGTVDFDGLVEDVHIGRNLIFCGARRVFAGINAEDFNNPTLYGYYNLYGVISNKSVTATDIWSKGDSICLGTTYGGLFFFRTGYIGLSELIRKDFIKGLRLKSNPARKQIALCLDRNQEYTIQLYDVSGRLRRNLKVAGKERLVIPTTGLKSGVHILQVKSATESFKKSIIVVE